MLLRTWPLLLASGVTSLSIDRRAVFGQIGAAAAIISNPPPAASSVINPSTLPPRVWLDADPSGFVWSGLDCDDDLAILVALALQDNHKIQLEGLSVCGGNAPLRHTWKDMQVLLRHADQPSLPPYYKGYGWRSMQVSRKWLQWMNRLQPDVPDSNDATQAILDAAFAQNKDQKLTVITVGPPTNLAKALRQNPALASQLEHVYMMGGELTQQRLDLNFASDRAAARTVVDANVPTTMIPIQVCAQVILDDVFAEDVESNYCSNDSGNNAAACALLPKMKQQVKTMPKLVNQAVAERMPADGRWRPSPDLDRGFIPWDIVAILSVSHPELFDKWEYHTASFPTCSPEDGGGGEPCGRTMVVRDLPKDKWPTTTTTTTTSKNQSAHQYYDHSGIVRIPHIIRDETKIKALMKDLLFQRLTSAKRSPPNIMLGFLGPLGLIGTTASTTVGLLGKRLSS